LNINIEPLVYNGEATSSYTKTHRASLVDAFEPFSPRRSKADLLVILPPKPLML